MWALVPVKRFVAGKSRLTSVLSGKERTELICSMLEDVLSALRRSPSVDKVMVLSNESGIDAMLAAAGAERLAEPEEGDVNRSLMAAVGGLPTSVDRVLILPGDVPSVGPCDIEALSDVHTGGVVVCPSAVDGGTNALLSSLPLAISLHFGTESLVRHLESARSCGTAIRLLRRRGLARDLDRSDDLDWLAKSPYECRTRTYLRLHLKRLAA